jgi:hypothetical protein
MSGPKTVGRIVTAIALPAILSVSAAFADDTYHFKDVLRPHGYERSLTAKLADGRLCGATGSHFSGDVQAFKKCMRAHGWIVDRYTPDHKVHVGDHKNHSSYIDPDTGMSCRNVGGVGICEPPRGTVRYFDPEQGLNCQRTGIVSICSNF